MRSWGARTRTVLCGGERRASVRGVALAAGLFVIVFADVTVGPGLTFHVEYALAAVLGLLAAFLTYREAGLLVAVLVATAPLYALFVELLHVGNTGPAPYDATLVRALPFALAAGIVVGLVGGTVGLVARVRAGHRGG